MQTISTWNESASVKAKEIFETAHWSDIDVASIRNTFERLSTSYFYDTSATSNALVSNLWAGVGAAAIAWGRSNDFNISYGFLVDTLIRKQRDYGHHNIAKYGRQGLIIRVHDKISRLENLVTHKDGNGLFRETANEPISDTILDIVGYAAIGLMWESESFMLPLK